MFHNFVVDFLVMKHICILILAIFTCLTSCSKSSDSGSQSINNTGNNNNNNQQPSFTTIAEKDIHTIDGTVYLDANGNVTGTESTTAVPTGIKTQTETGGTVSVSLLSFNDADINKITILSAGIEVDMKSGDPVLEYKNVVDSTAKTITTKVDVHFNKQGNNRFFLQGSFPKKTSYSASDITGMVTNNSQKVTNLIYE